MKKTIQEKGITLIALIITIVVLLILAVVTINAIQGDGIIEYAKNARYDYQKAQNAEQDMLEYYESYLSGTVGEWKQEGVTLTRTNSDGTKTELKIGDYVNYIEGTYKHTPEVVKGAGTSKTSGSASAGYKLATSELTTEDLSWRVLGLNEKGEIELISADATTQILYLANDEGYVNAEDNLNNFCNDLYGQGTNSEGKKVATGARSLKVEDIDKLANYDPTSLSSYGLKLIYRYPTQEEMDEFTGTENSTRYMQYSKDEGATWTNITNSNYQKFRLPQETTAISSSNPGSIELEHKYYSYTISTVLKRNKEFTSEEATEILNMITKGTTSSNISYWLASGQPNFGSGDMVTFIVHVVTRGFMGGEWMYYSFGNQNCVSRYVRPVVSLSSEVSFSGSGDDIGSSSNMWNIS